MSSSNLSEYNVNSYEDDADENWGSELVLSEPIPLQKTRSFGPECYAYNPNSKYMKKPEGKPSDRIVVGLNPGSHENYKAAKERTALTVKLMEQISESVQIFRPSESLYNLDQIVDLSEDYNDDNNGYSGGNGNTTNTTSSGSNTGTPPSPEEDDQGIEIDVVLSGGGLKGYFMCGAGYILLKELKKKNIKINRIGGASAGSWAGMFMLTGISSEAWIETYFANMIRPGSHLLEAYRELWPEVKKALPHDAYITCTNKLFISLTEITWSGIQNRIVSEFTSNEDLFEACCASSTIPYMSAPIIYANYRGMRVLDGGLTNNTPVFPDGLRRQLVFRLYEVEYPWRQMLNPTDTCIETLVLRGALLMSRFLQGEPQDCITWLEQKEKKEDLPDAPIYSRFLVRGLLLPLVLGGYIVSRGSGLSKLVKGFIPKSAANLIIPFAQSGAAFGTSTVRYIGTTLFAGIVEILRNFRFLL